MRQVKFILLTALFMTLAGCGNHFTKGKSVETPEAVATTQPKPKKVCGGYTEQREPTEEEMEMFKSLTSSESVTLTPLSVSTQVVAGLNYRFWCRYQEKKRGGHCWVKIFRPLPGQGEPELVSIEKEAKKSH